MHPSPRADTSSDPSLRVFMSLPSRVSRHLTTWSALQVKLGLPAMSFAKPLNEQASIPIRSRSFAAGSPRRATPDANA